jgi:hypothetical protein
LRQIESSSLISSAFGSSTPDFKICHATYQTIEAASHDFSSHLASGPISSGNSHCLLFHVPFHSVFNLILHLWKVMMAVSAIIPCRLSDTLSIVTDVTNLRFTHRQLNLHLMISIFLKYVRVAEIKPGGVGNRVKCAIKPQSLALDNYLRSQMFLTITTI